VNLLATQTRLPALAKPREQSRTAEPCSQWRRDSQHCELGRSAIGPFAGALLLCALTGACSQPRTMPLIKKKTDAGLSAELELAGEWSSSDFKCGTARRTELLSIEQQGAHISARKLSGDQCVPTGYLSFEGDLPQAELSHADLPLSFPIQYYDGKPGQPETIAVAARGTATLAQADEITLQVSGDEVLLSRVKGDASVPLPAAASGGSAGGNVAGGGGNAGAVGHGAGAGGATQVAGHGGAAGHAAGSGSADCPGPFLPGASCDQVAQCGCALGENCQIPTTTLPPTCVPAGSLREGDRCQELDDCEVGRMCSAELCVRTCNEDAQCPSGLCEGVLANDSGLVIEGIKTCALACQPVLPAACYRSPVPNSTSCQPCGANVLCLPHVDIAFCEVAIATIQLPGKSCSADGECFGSGCFDGTCRQWCRTDADCATAGQLCTLGFDLFAALADEIGACLPPG
jgi:hypothetical protein